MEWFVTSEHHWSTHPRKKNRVLRWSPITYPSAVSRPFTNGIWESATGYENLGHFPQGKYLFDVKRFNYISMLFGTGYTEDVFICWLINRRHGHFHAFIPDMIDLNCLTASNNIWVIAKLLEGLAPYICFRIVSSEEVFICC